MKEIIKYVILRDSKQLNKSYKNRTLLFNLVCDADLDGIGITNKERRKYVRSNIEFFKEVSSNYLLIYIYEYLIKYKLPNIEELYKVYKDEIYRYMLIEALRINTPITLRHKNIDSCSIINAYKINTHIYNKNNTDLLYMTTDNIVSLLNLYDTQVNETLLAWEEQGICLRISNNLVVILSNVFNLLGQQPSAMVNYLLKWGRNERLKDLKLI